MGFAISGATVRAASDTQAFSLLRGGAQGAVALQGSATFYVTGLTAGSTTFTAKYDVDHAGRAPSSTGRSSSSRCRRCTGRAPLEWAVAGPRSVSGNGWSRARNDRGDPARARRFESLVLAIATAIAAVIVGWLLVGNHGSSTPASVAVGPVLVSADAARERSEVARPPDLLGRPAEQLVVRADRDEQRPRLRALPAARRRCRRPALELPHRRHVSGRRCRIRT